MIVAVLGLIAVFGNAGLITKVTGIPISVFGFHGVVLAHVFFNLPLATRLILQGWLSIPSERFRLAASLGTNVSHVLERPMLRAVVPGAFMVIFLICLTSFAVALALGGGPKATTVELAIYQAFRFEFDLGKAALLGLVQFALCALAATLSFWIAVPQALGVGLDRNIERWDRSHWALDAGWITLVALFLLTPLGMIIWDGLPRVFSLHDSVWPAALRSIIIAVVSAGLAVGLALALATWIVSLGPKGRWVEAIGVLPLAASQLVVGTGLFLMIFPFASPRDWALVVTALVNAVATVPFSLRALVPAVRDAEAGYGRLADQMGLTGLTRLRLMILPRIRRPLGFSAGLAAALSMGDLGVIALFAEPGGATLPMAVYALMGAYRMDEAAGAALLLLSISLALFWLFDKGGRTNATT
jgi:thiamine transport system permease protein